MLGDNEQPDYRTVYEILSENARDSYDDNPEHDEDWLYAYNEALLKACKERFARPKSIWFGDSRKPSRLRGNRVKDAFSINVEQWSKDCIGLFGKAHVYLMDAQLYLEELEQRDESGQISAMLNNGEIQNLIDGIWDCLTRVKKALK